MSSRARALSSTARRASGSTGRGRRRRRRRRGAGRSAASRVVPAPPSSTPRGRRAASREPGRHLGRARARGVRQGLRAGRARRPRSRRQARRGDAAPPRRRRSTSSTTLRQTHDPADRAPDGAARARRSRGAIVQREVTLDRASCCRRWRTSRSSGSASRAGDDPPEPGGLHGDARQRQRRRMGRQPRDASCADPSIGRGGCLVESDFGSVDASVERAVRRAERGRSFGDRALRSAMSGGPLAARSAISIAVEARRSACPSSAASCARSACWSNRAARARASASCASCQRGGRAAAAARSRRLPRRVLLTVPLGTTPASGPATSSSRAAARAGAGRRRSCSGAWSTALGRPLDGLGPLRDRRPTPLIRRR